MSTLFPSCERDKRKLSEPSTPSVTTKQTPSILDLPSEVQLIVYGYVFGPWTAVFAPPTHSIWSHVGDILGSLNSSVLYRWYLDSAKHSNTPLHHGDAQERNSIGYTCKTVSALALEAREKCFTGRFETNVPTEIASYNLNLKEFVQSSKYAKAFSKIHTLALWDSMSAHSEPSTLLRMVRLLPALRRIDLSTAYNSEYIGPCDSYVPDGNTDVITMKADFVDFLRDIHISPIWADSRLREFEAAGQEHLRVYIHIKTAWSQDGINWQRLVSYCVLCSN